MKLFKLSHISFLLQEKTLEGKIKDDTFRTFKNDKDFWSKVDESTLFRILTAIASDYGYVQGMNVLLGPLIFTMPELDSYYCMKSLIAKHMPFYVTKNLDGVHRGIGLVDRCLQIFDPVLREYLLRKLKTLSILSVRYLLTLLANLQPLSEVIKLWDYTFAFGVHFTVIAFCAYLISLRENILNETSGYK